MEFFESLSFRWGRWYYDHDRWVRWFGLGAVIAVMATVSMITTSRLVKVLLQDSSLNQVLVQDSRHLAEGIATLGASAPAELSAAPLQLITRASGIDVLGELTNPNRLWKARAHLRITGSSGESVQRVLTILPATAQPLIARFDTGSAVNASPVLTIEQVDWVHLADKNEQPRLATFILGETVVEPSGSGTLVTVELANKTPQSFLNIEVLVRWLDGERVVGARVLSLGQLKEYEKRRISFQDDSAIPSFVRFTVDPLFDPTDPAFMTPVHSTVEPLLP